MTENILQYLTHHSEFLLIAIFAVSLMESLAVVGIIVPGVGLLAAMSVLAGQAQIAFYWLLLCGALGAILGDSISYGIGKLFQDRLHNYWPFTTHPHWISDGQTFFRQYGAISIFLGRFIGPIRPMVPLVAGILKMDKTRFIKWNVLSAVCWAPAYLLPGYLLGEHLDLAWLTSWQGLLVLLLMSAVAICLTIYFKRSKNLQ